MSAFRGRTQDANWVEVTLSPFAIPALLRKAVGDRSKERVAAEKFSRRTRFAVLVLGIAASWSPLLILASFLIS